MDANDSPVPPPAAPPLPAAPAVARSGVETGMLLIAAGMFVLMLMGALLRPIFFDERAHLNYLWQISQNLHPYRDFWCIYPVAGYALFLPIFKLLPENGADIIVLRFCAVLCVAGSLAVVCAWSRKLCGRWWLPLLPALLLATASGSPDGGTARVLVEFRTDGPALLLAFVAISLLLGDARGWRRVLCLACTVLSLAIMPKYLYVLAACHGCDWLGKILEKRFRARIIYESVAGALLGLFLGCVMIEYANADPLDSWRWGFVMQDQFQNFIRATDHANLSFGKVTFTPFIYNTPWLTLTLAAGFLAYIYQMQYNRWRGTHFWICAGLIVGAAITFWRTPLPFEQYLPPVLLPLVFLFPFVGLILARIPRVRWAEWFTLALLVVLLATNLRSESIWLAQGDLIDDITLENRLQKLVPKDYRVYGAFTLLFRRPLTFVSFDERWGTPPGFSSLIKDDPRMVEEFSTARLSAALHANLPAVIDLSRNSPPGWLVILQDYLKQNQKYYTRVRVRGDFVYFRKDLHPPGTAQSSVKIPANPLSLEAAPLTTADPAPEAPATTDSHLPPTPPKNP